MASPVKSLYRRIERALETIALGSTPLQTITSTASTLVDTFADDLGIRGGRIYARDEGTYDMVATFGNATASGIGTQVRRDYAPIEQLLDEGCVVMRRSDPALDPLLEEVLGTRPLFAASSVADGQFILSFDVEPPDRESDDIISMLNIVRFAINQKIREESLLSILEEARRIQLSILPKRIPRYGDFDLAARTVATEIVGGDAYDLITLTESTFAVVVADATGHGLPAALQVRDVATGLRMGLSREFKLSRTVERLNQLIHRTRLSTRFVSLFIAEVHVDGTVVYCNAGHPPALLVRADGTTARLSRGGLLLGPRANSRYTIDLVRLAPGDVIVMYSDGITEATSPTTGEELGISSLEALVRDHRQLSAAQLVETVFATVADFSAQPVPSDDQTVAVIRHGRLDTDATSRPQRSPR
jgi:sigma-B regulation protein RsbU (phosphoserine phosphatase)